MTTRSPVGTGSTSDTYQYFNETAAKGARIKDLPDVPQSVYDMVDEQTDDRTERQALRQRLDVIQSWIDAINALPPEKRLEMMQKLFGAPTLQAAMYADFDDENITAAGRILAAVIAGDEDDLEDMIIDVDGGIFDDALDNDELNAVNACFDAALLEIGVDPLAMDASGGVNTGIWTDTLELFSRPEFFDDADRKAKGVWFETNDQARALFAAKGAEGLHMYREVERAMRLANETMGMLTPEQAAQFIAEFFGNVSGDFDDEGDKTALGRIIAAIMSGDIGAIQEAVDACDIEEMNTAFETFSKEVSSWRSANDVHPAKDKAARDFWNWLNGMPSGYKPPPEVQAQMDERMARTKRA